jgi:site-specific DNA-adenine methylase
MNLIGEKRKQYYNDFISKFIPSEFSTYVEAFGGTFAVGRFLSSERSSQINYIYNDINLYEFEIDADKIHHLDYKEIFKIYDNENTVFYLDPPYYRKEFYYTGCENFKHEELRDELINLKGKVILSYEDCRFIRNLYHDFNINLYDGDNKIFQHELIITNF